jgi:DNA-binding GntR family transcriptional regulator
MKAIKDRDPEAAYEASKEHIRRAAAVAIRSLPEKLLEKTSTEKGENDAE